MANLRIYNKYIITYHRHRVFNNAVEFKRNSSSWSYYIKIRYIRVKHDTTKSNKIHQVQIRIHHWNTGYWNKIDGWIFKESSNSEGESWMLTHSIWLERKAKYKTLESGHKYLWTVNKLKWTVTKCISNLKDAWDRPSSKDPLNYLLCSNIRYIR